MINCKTQINISLKIIHKDQCSKVLKLLRKIKFRVLIGLRQTLNGNFKKILLSIVKVYEKDQQISKMGKNQTKFS